MFFNIVAGFIIPWIIAKVVLPNQEIILFIAPISSVIAFAINNIGCYFFWDLRPVFSRQQGLSSLPIDLGLFPVGGCFLIYLIAIFQINSFIMILLFSIFTTVVELIAVKFNKVIYRNGWNGYLTFLSYLIAYMLVYGYYLILILNQYNVF